MKKLFFSFFCVFASVSVFAQQNLKPLPFGDFDQWMVRRIKESFVIGGKVSTVYAIAPLDTVVSTEAYVNRSASPWATSNVMAKVAGVVKTSVTVFPERRGNGYCVRMDTKLEKVKVLGMINISVLASGSIYLGHTVEPIKGASDPYRNLDMGIKFTGTPKAVVFDYKARISQDSMVTRATGTTVEKIRGRDSGETVVFLQRRWEDKDGDIYAERIATARERYNRTVPDWVNGHRLELHYGNISDQPYFDKSMGLMRDGDFFAMNSRGKMVPVKERGWGRPGEKPTHMILMFSSGSLGAYTGALGNSLWVDNVMMEY